MPPEPTRTDDDILLRVMQMRQDGLTVGEIASIMGWSPRRQRAEIDAVIAADLRESGERNAVVRAAHGLPS
jgi:hypothetical protein